eukprot:CAMPEP_0197552124 /NCGR_PEP_ID=MMETSP1320-20131121/5764_1 /TAXON_ID=91990 /ORGANISM="Bolidomonas sp., Strain RCC2347" /LENGTH=110 /DNA_ID=CAMNT_0043112697 /DNA_START=155 /DNA_END=486 /DNA_ORIENTATION=+
MGSTSSPWALRLRRARASPCAQVWMEVSGGEAYSEDQDDKGGGVARVHHGLPRHPTVLPAPAALAIYARAPEGGLHRLRLGLAAHQTTGRGAPEAEGTSSPQGQAASETS